MEDLSAKIDELALRMDNGFNRVNADIHVLREETKAEFAAVRREMDKRFDKVDARFDKVDKRFDKVDERFEKVDERFERVDERFERVNEKFESLHRLMVQFSGILLAALIGALAALITQV